jgi:hypothetical protein
MLTTIKEGYTFPIPNPKFAKENMIVTANALSSDPNHLSEKLVIEFHKKKFHTEIKIYPIMQKIINY